jgi:hypothetical protein
MTENDLIRGACVVGTLLLASTQPSAAQGEDTALVISLRQTAQHLYQAGVASDDPRLVLGAAELLIMVDRESPGIGVLGMTQIDSTWPEDVRRAYHLTARAALREASQMAEDHRDAAIARAAAELASNPKVGIVDSTLAQELQSRARRLVSRGATGGPLWRDGYLAPGQSAEYWVAFEGGRIPNRVDVAASDRRANLECNLIDGEKVTKGQGAGGACSLKWDQRTTGKVTLRVLNNGTGSYFVISSN